MFSKIDLRSCYHHLKIKPRIYPKQLFEPDTDTMSFLVMSFGLTNAPTAFMDLMNRVFKKYLDKFVIVFIDDILIYSKTEEDHAEHLRITLEILRKENYILNLPSVSLVKRGSIFRHVVNQEGIKVDPSKIEAIMNWERPRRQRKLEVLWDWLDIIERFVQDFSKIATPLTKLTRKNEKFEWNEKCEASFQELRQRLVTAPVLAFQMIRRFCDLQRRFFERIGLCIDAA